MAVQVAAAAGGIAALTKTLGAADQYTNMQNRLLALGASHESAAAQIRQLGDIALATRAPLESTVELYSRLSLTSESLGASQSELMEFTETVGLALAASGTTAAQASGALTQLSQAMAGGVVRAEEFNSMIEGAPGLLMAVANGIEGVNGDLGALRQMMLDGELTSEQFFNALLSQNEALQESFGNTAPTIASAFTAINSEFTLFIGSADQATGVTSAIAEVMLLLAENMEVAVPVFGAVAIGVAAITAPVLAAGVAIGGLAIAVITHWDEIKQAFEDGVDYVVGLGSRLVQALKDAGRMALDAALNIGAEIINGISTGIDRKFQELKDKITDLGVYLPEWLKDMLGIASPSKVFAEIGEWTVDGLIVGMDDREDALRTRAETLGVTMGEGIKDGLDPVLRTVFDGLARGDLGSIGSGLLNMAQSGFSTLLQTSFSKDGGGLSSLWKSISGGFSNIGANYSSAGGGLAGIGSAISGLLPGIGAISSIVGVVQSLVGTTTKLTNALEGTLGIGGLLRGTEYDIKQNDNLFGSSTERNSEEIFGSWAGLIAQDLDQEFRDMVQNTRDGIRALGLDINEAFTYDFDVQFDESLPHEQLMQQLRAELDKANDELLRTSLAAAGLARDGETGAQTLGILNDSLRTANASLRLLDQALFDVSAIGAGAARELIEMSGGLDAFAGKTTFVFDNFLTESERTARGLQIATENMAAFEAQAGITLPETHAEFMALLDAQDLNTDAGRNLYAALLDVADEFVTVNGSALDAVPVLEEAADAIEAVADNSRELAAIERERGGLLLQIARMTGNVAYIRQQELAALDAVNRPLQEHIYLLEDQAAAVEAQNAALRDALATAQEALSIAEGAFDSAVNVLRGLVENAEEQLAAAEDAARRAFDAQADTVRAEFGGMIDAVNTAADAQITLAQEQVDAINAEREAAAERAALQAVAVRDQISLLEGVLGSLESALDNRRALTPEGRVMELAQAQAFLSNAVANGGTTDVDALENALAIVADPSTDLFKSFEDYQFDFAVNTGFIKKLRDLTDDSLSVEQRTLNALEAQAEFEQSSAAEQIAAIEAARDAEIAALEAEMGAQLDRLDEQLNALLGIDTSVLTIAAAQAGLLAAQELVVAANEALLQVTQEGNANIVASLGAIATALADALAAQDAVTDATDAVTGAQDDIDNATGGSGGGSIFDNMNSAEKRLYGILNALEGAGGAASLGVGAFGAFSQDNMNAILTDAGVAALSGSAAAAAQAFEEALGRNIDVAGLGFYTGVIDAQTDQLGSLEDAMEFVRRDVAANGDQFEYAIQQMARRLGPPIDATAAAAQSAILEDGAFHAANIGQLVTIGEGIMTLGAAMEGLAAGAVEGAAAVPAISVGTSEGMSTADRMVSDALALAATVEPGSVAEGAYLAAAAEWTRRGGSVPSYANGTSFHPGGFARLHENEMVNLPRGTGVSTAGEVSQAAVERKRTNELLAEVNERLRYLQDKERVQTRIMNDWNINGTPGTRDGAVVKTEAAS